MDGRRGGDIVSGRGGGGEGGGRVTGRERDRGRGIRGARKWRRRDG